MPALPARRPLAALAAALCAGAGLLAAPPAIARDGLGVFGNWAAFRDGAVPRCYAIALAEPERAGLRGGNRQAGLPRQFDAYADVGSWPRRGVRGQLHLRASRRLGAGVAQLSLGGQRIALTSGQADLWAADPRADAAIMAAMRQGGRMQLLARDASGHLFTDSWQLDGAACAMDAATLACAADARR
ncbi:MAG TPA: hypothetical protein VFF98_11265 [Novosphingobium sp.]|nr:hypothetical protein [Novosphingobium sp.]